MTLTGYDEADREFAQADVEHTYLVRFQWGAPRAEFELITNSVSGLQLQVDVGATSYTINEGSEFDIGADTLETATNIAAAFEVLGLPSWVELSDGVVGTHRVFVLGNFGISFAFSSSDPGAVEEIQQFDVDQYAVSGHRNLFGHPFSVLRVSPISYRFDSRRKEWSISDVELLMRADPELLLRMERTPIKNRRVIIKEGTPNLTEAQFRPIGTFVVMNYSTDPGLTEGDLQPIKLRLGDAYSAGVRQERSNLRIQTQKNAPRHPLSQLAFLHQRSTAAALIDNTNLDESLPGNEDWSHWCVCRPTGSMPVGVTGVLGPNTTQVEFTADLGEDTIFSETVQSLLRSMPGQFLPMEDGLARWKRFTNTTVADHTWLESDIDIDPISSYMRGQSTRFVFKSWPDIEPGADFPREYSENDDTASRNYSFEGLFAKPEEKPRTIRSDWVNGWGALAVPLDAADTELVVTGAAITGISGAQFDGNANQNPGYNPGTQATINGLQTAVNGRKAYLRLWQPDNGLRMAVGVADFSLSNRLGGQEIIRVDAIRVVEDYSEVAPDGRAYPKLAFTIDQRDVDGDGTPERWGQAVVQDVTIPRGLAALDFEQFADGSPEIKVWTDYSKGSAQVGDTVFLPERGFITYRQRGQAQLQTGSLFRIASKECHGAHSGGRAGYRWVLEFIRRTPYQYQRRAPASDVRLDRRKGFYQGPPMRTDIGTQVPASSTRSLWSSDLSEVTSGRGTLFANVVGVSDDGDRQDWSIEAQITVANDGTVSIDSSTITAGAGDSPDWGTPTVTVSSGILEVSGLASAGKIVNYRGRAELVYTPTPAV